MFEQELIVENVIKNKKGTEILMDVFNKIKGGKPCPKELKSL